jgi:outer membrane autotransporter protein
MLVVNGSLAGDVTVNTLGRLQGVATIDGTFMNAGTIAPGNSIGTITVGNYIHNGGIYDVEVNGAGQSDLIHALGTATINGGTVVVNSVDSTLKFNTPYTIVTADTALTGQFTSATSSNFITPRLTYDSNNVFVTIDSALRNAATTCNQRGVATILDSITNPNDSQSLLIGRIATLPLASAQQALESLSGFQYTNQVWTTEIFTDRFLRRLYDPLRYQVTACEPIKHHDWTTWFETGPNFSNVQGINARVTRAVSYQVTGGLQRFIVPDFCIGFAASYEYDRETFINAQAHRNAVYLGLYGLCRPDIFYLLFDIAYSYAGSNLNRTIQAGNVSYTASGHPNSNTFASYAELGVDCKAKKLLIQPFVGMQVGKNWRSQVTEHSSSGWGLSIDEYQWDSVSSRFGLHVSTCNTCDSPNLSLDVAWNQRITSTHNATTGRFQTFGNAYRICGNKLDATSVDYALTLAKSYKEAFQCYIQFEGQVWNHAYTNGFLLGMTYAW